MKKRLAQKAFKGPYYQIWINPSTKQEIWVPRNGRCWNIIRRACYYRGHPEWIEEMTNDIVNGASKGINSALFSET